MSNTTVGNILKIAVAVILIALIIGACSKALVDNTQARKTEVFTTKTENALMTEKITENAENNLQTENDEAQNFVVNVNSGVYHLAECRHVERMNGDNKEYIHATPEEMKSRGYSPCGTCNP